MGTPPLDLRNLCTPSTSQLPRNYTSSMNQRLSNAQSQLGTNSISSLSSPKWLKLLYQEQLIALRSITKQCVALQRRGTGFPHTFPWSLQKRLLRFSGLMELNQSQRLIRFPGLMDVNQSQRLLIMFSGLMELNQSY